MSKIHIGDGASVSASLGAGDWLGLAAMPTFAGMALLTTVSGGSDVLCMAAQDASPLTGMAFMYLLMGAFHSAPWLKLLARLRATASEDGAEPS